MNQDKRQPWQNFYDKAVTDDRDRVMIANAFRIRQTSNQGTLRSAARQMVKCPKCGQPAKHWCRTSSQRLTVNPHIARIDLAVAVLEMEGVTVKYRRK